MGSSKEETVDEQKKQIYEESDFKDVIEKADKLQEDYHQRERNVDMSDRMPNLSISTWLTGINEGEVIDMKIDPETDDLVLNVRVDTGEIQNVRVLNKGTEYTDRNEIVRLLEYKGIDEGRIEKLLGEEIPIRVTRYALPSNQWAEMNWRPYIPAKMNKFGKTKHGLNKILRYLGYEGQFQGKAMALGFLAVSIFWWSVVFAIISTGFIAMSSMSASYSLILSSVMTLSLLMTVYTPLILRVARIGREKYIEFSSQDKTIR